MHLTCWAFLPSGAEWLYIGVLFVLLFGADKLPAFARGLGRTLGEFKRAKEEMEEELRRATEEDTRPRIRPRADNDDEAIARSPKTLPVNTDTAKAALPAPAAESAASDNLSLRDIAETLPAAAVATAAATATATGEALANTAVAAAHPQPDSATHTTTATTPAPAPASVTPVLRPVTTAVAFGSVRRTETPATPAPSAPTAGYEDDFDMPTTQLDDNGEPISPFAEQSGDSTTHTHASKSPAASAHGDEDDTERRPSSFVL